MWIEKEELEGCAHYLLGAPKIRFPNELAVLDPEFRPQTTGLARKWTPGTHKAGGSKIALQDAVRHVEAQCTPSTLAVSGFHDDCRVVSSP